MSSPCEEGRHLPRTLVERFCQICGLDLPAPSLTELEAEITRLRAVLDFADRRVLNLRESDTAVSVAIDVHAIISPPDPG